MSSATIALSDEALLRALLSQQKRPNFLVTCHDVPVDDVVQRLLNFCAAPFHFCTVPRAFGLPTTRAGTLFLADAGLLTMKQQVELFDWMTISRETQVVSVTELPLGRLVSNGDFLDGLFFRLNVVSLDASARKQAAGARRDPFADTL